MKRINWDSVGAQIGKQLRFISVGIALGMWQSSVAAGIFGYLVAVTLEPL